jgi:hypothetical protein
MMSVCAGGNIGFSLYFNIITILSLSLIYTYIMNIYDIYS